MLLEIEDAILQVCLKPSFGRCVKFSKDRKRLLQGSTLQRLGGDLSKKILYWAVFLNTFLSYYLPFPRHCLPPAEGELAKLQRQFRLLEGDRHAYALESRETIRRQTYPSNFSLPRATNSPELALPPLPTKVHHHHGHEHLVPAHQAASRPAILPPLKIPTSSLLDRIEVKRLEKENEDLRYKQGVAEGHANQKKEKAQSEILRSLLTERDAVKEQIMKEKKRIARLDQEIETWENRLADRKQMMGSDSMIQEQRAHLQRKIQSVENQLDKISSEFSSQLVLNSQLREDLEILRVGHDHFEQQYKDLEEELLETRKTIINVVSTSSAAYDARDEAHARLGQLRDKAEKDLKQYVSEMKELERFLENDRRMSAFVNIKLQERTFTEEALKAKAKKHRERNFAQFNYVNEQNSQKDRLWEEIHELHETEGQQEDTVKEANQAEQNVKRFLKIWEQLKSVVTETVMDNDEPYDTVETAQLLLGQTPGLRPTAITVRPPTAGLGHEPIQEEDNRPLTHEELREKVIKE
ncbi:Coiled-coil domain-containing protein, partial [Ophiophagus hannah]